MFALCKYNIIANLLYEDNQKYNKPNLKDENIKF